MTQPGVVLSEEQAKKLQEGIQVISSVFGLSQSSGSGSGVGVRAALVSDCSPSTSTLASEQG